MEDLKAHHSTIRRDDHGDLATEFAGAGATSQTLAAPPPPAAAEQPQLLRPVSLTQMASCVQDDLLLTEYNILAKEDPRFYYQVEEAVWLQEQKLAAAAEAEAQRLKQEEGILPEVDDGQVGRRAPKNPFHSPKLGKYRHGKGQDKKKDPALKNNPLQGKLLVTFNVNTALLFVFFQVMVYEWFKYGNGFGGSLGPQGITLLDFGGLDTNKIRAGEVFRVFWAMWMHSGFLHIGFNVLCQLQFFFMLEPDWGFWRTFMLFFVSGISGNIMSAILDPCSVTVGSSGGLYGLMGAMVPYCIEYWKSIPRPTCILVFSVVVIIISVVQGFIVNGTDNWAHLGGLFGGILFGLMTITTLSVFNWDVDNSVPDTEKISADSRVIIDPDGRKRKRVVKRTKFNHIIKKYCSLGRCKCGIREWLVRLTAFFLLLILWIVCWILLLESYTSYSPPGYVSFSGTSNCVCCWEPVDDEQQYSCYLGEHMKEGITWEAYCDAQTDARRSLLLDDELAPASLSPHTADKLENLVNQNELVEEWQDTDTILGALLRWKRFNALNLNEEGETSKWHHPIHVLAG